MRRLVKNQTHNFRDPKVNDGKVDRNKSNGYQNYDRVAYQFFAVRPSDFLHLGPAAREEGRNGSESFLQT